MLIAIGICMAAYLIITAAIAETEAALAIMIITIIAVVLYDLKQDWRK